MLPYPGMKIGDQRGAVLLAYGKTLLGRLAGDGALDLEQGVDTTNNLEREWRDDGRLLALRPGAGCDFNIGEDEELAPTVGPTGGLQNGCRLAVGGVELVVAAVGVGLQDAGPPVEMLAGMRARAALRLMAA